MMLLKSQLYEIEIQKNMDDEIFETISKIEEIKLNSKNPLGG